MILHNSATSETADLGLLKKNQWLPNSLVGMCSLPIECLIVKLRYSANYYECVKAVEKVEPHEAVGVICLESGKARVVEYSEISKELAEKRDESGRLMLRAGNIANHFFTIDFLDHGSSSYVFMCEIMTLWSLVVE